MKEIHRKGPHGRSGSLASMPLPSEPAFPFAAPQEGRVLSEGGKSLVVTLIDSQLLATVLTRARFIVEGSKQIRKEGDIKTTRKDHLNHCTATTRVIIFATTELTAAKRQYMGIKSMPL